MVIRVNAPATVNRVVFDTASVAIVQDPTQPFTDAEIERITNEFKTFIESTDPSDFADEVDTLNDAPTDPPRPAR